MLHALLCKQVLAKEILATRKAVSRMYTNKAQLMDIGITLTQQMGEPSSRAMSASIGAGFALH